MNTSFYNGVSGVKTYQSGIDVWGNNIANVNTVGYKANLPEFGSIFSQTLVDGNNSPTEDQTGLGSRLASTAISMNQGTLQQSDNALDLAIQGDGWFGVSGINNQQFYTRSGNFSTNAEGYIVDGSGNFLLGTSADNIGLMPDPEDPTKTIPVLTKSVEYVNLTTPQGQGKLQLPTRMYYPPEASTKAEFKANLPVDYGTGQIFNLRAGLIAPDGSKHTLTIAFTKSAEQPELGTSWKYRAYIDEEGTPSSEVLGTLEFDERGALKTLPATFSIDNHGGPVMVTLGTTPYDGLVSIAGADIASSSVADGFPEGYLDGYRIDQEANIIASFDNGRLSSIGKIAVFHFQNDQGLEKAGGNIFRTSSNSGGPHFFTDNEGNTVLGAQVINNALENSNVSLATALTELIVMQKAFDANAKSITTADQMIQKAINMKK
ncbi:flagellar hook protein FlgE [Hydrogenimonas cancrithermarum]|uniref:Flagellar hook protein FlgE n=1 Tax=Hydrogenimonas cancrithermarum TaxID=2993563 RepID=A0ABN6WYA2_9BACT|nr:flagellar hook-basal body complex protein [Hydrogenimonas cancrithermarum]BDY13087.1 flagellar hook protein FlgE [Hydrogenimonas cancrithermarum]